MRPYTPWEGVVLPKVVKYNAHIYTIEEMTQALNCQGHGYVSSDSVGHQPDFRRGEILGLRWEYIAFDKSIVYIRDNCVISDPGI